MTHFSANHPRLPLPSGAQQWRDCDHRKSSEQNNFAPRKGFDLQCEGAISRRASFPPAAKPGMSLHTFLPFSEKDIPGGAVTCSEGFVYFFESSPGCWAVLQLPCCPSKTRGTFRKHNAKSSEQISAPDCTLTSVAPGQRKHGRGRTYLALKMSRSAPASTDGRMLATAAAATNA